MRPYYDRDGITLYNSDALLTLTGLPDDAADLTITDPPFNAGLDYGPHVDDKRPWVEYTAWLSEIVAELERVTAGPVFLFLSVTAMVRLCAVRPPRWVCAWDKPMSYSHRVGGSPFLPHWEPCLVYGRVWGAGGRVPDYSLSDVWHANPVKRNGHPCPKPLSLIEWLMARVPGQTVLDPFFGSGTTARAALNLGRRFIGVEQNRAYCDLAIERLSQQVFALGGTS